MKMPQWMGRLLRMPSVAAGSAGDVRRSDAEALKSRGNAHLAKGELDAAIACYRQAVAIDPAYAEAINNLGVALQKQGHHDEAMALFQQAMRLAPTLANAHLNHGNALMAKGRLDEAIAAFRTALEFAPGLSDAHNNLGNLFQTRNELDAAQACFEAALRHNPNSAIAHRNLGELLQERGRLGEALAHLQEAIALDPNLAEAQYSLAIALLCCGRLGEGWLKYKHRFDIEDDNPLRRPFAAPEWSAEPLEDKTILVWGDQGVGDEILFASMFPEIVARAGRCIIECTYKLVPLFARSFPGATVVPRTVPPHPATGAGVDFQIAAADAARWLRPGIESFPRHEGYLTPDPVRVAYWKGRLAELGPGLKVGFCWRSSLVRDRRHLHYTGLDQWGPIFAVPGIHFINLQYDDCAEELAAARRRFGVPLHVFEDVDLFNDLDEAAALTKAMDLVITAATAASGLAAAQGVPTWEMGYGTTWVSLGTDHVPWFPSQRLFMRGWDQSWEEVIAEVARQLQDYRTI